MPRCLFALSALLVAAPASAQELVGVLTHDDIQVVQDVLHPKAGRLEIGGHLGWLPFDPLVHAPKAELSIDKHLSEVLAISVMIGGGYGLKTGMYDFIENPPYGVAPDAYRYLASALVGVSWAPVYGKLTANGKKVVHYDVFFTGRLGATLSQSVIDDSAITGAPTLALGVGGRFFVTDTLAVRAELRDDLMVEWRPTVSAWDFKQNAGVTLGITWMGKKGGR